MKQIRFFKMDKQDEDRQGETSPLIRVATAARIKGVRRQAIYYHIERRHLRTKVIDGVVYVYRDEVEELDILKPSHTRLG